MEVARVESELAHRHRHVREQFDFHIVRDSRKKRYGIPVYESYVQATLADLPTFMDLAEGFARDERMSKVWISLSLWRQTLAASVHRSIVRPTYFFATLLF